MTDREKAAYIVGIMHAAAHAGCCFDHFQDNDHIGEVVNHIVAELGLAADDPLIGQIHGEIHNASKATPQITRKEIEKLWNRVNRATTARRPRGGK